MHWSPLVLKLIIPFCTTAGLLMYFIVAKWFIWPLTRRYTLDQILLPLVMMHLCRYLGIMFSLSGTAGELPPEFVVPATLGDLATTAACWGAVLAMKWDLSFRRFAVLLFNLIGTADFIVAFYMGYKHIPYPGNLGVTFFVVTFMVPALIMSHCLIYALLLRGEPRRVNSANPLPI